MKILFVDLLNTTYNGYVRDGVFKHSYDEAMGLHIAGHEVTFAYCGIKMDVPFKTQILSSKGYNDGCTIKRKDIYLTIKGKYDAIFLTTQFMTGLEPFMKAYINTPKYFIVHDCYKNSLFINMGAVNKMLKAKQYNSKIIGNSNFTKWLYQLDYEEKKQHYHKQNIILEEGEQIIDDCYKQFTYVARDYEIETFEQKNYSICIGKFTKLREQNRLTYFHKYQNNHLIHLFGSTYSEEEEDYYQKIKAKEQFGTYKTHKSKSSNEIFEISKYAQNNIISWPREGFGYTALETGLYGVPSIIVKRYEKHATEDYLKEANAYYETVYFKDKEKLYELIKNYKLDKNQRLLNAHNLKNHFTIEKFIKDRERLLNDFTIKKHNTLL